MLSHGQPAMERGFIENKKVIKVNMDKIKINSRKLIIDHMSSHNLYSKSFPITESLLRSVRCSLQRYQEIKILLLLYHCLCLLDFTFGFEILLIQNQRKIHNNLRSGKNTYIFIKLVTEKL